MPNETIIARKTEKKTKKQTRDAPVTVPMLVLVLAYVALIASYSPLNACLDAPVSYR